MCIGDERISKIKAILSYDPKLLRIQNSSTFATTAGGKKSPNFLGQIQANFAYSGRFCLSVSRFVVYSGYFIGISNYIIIIQRNWVSTAGRIVQNMENLLEFDRQN